MQSAQWAAFKARCGWHAYYLWQKDRTRSRATALVLHRSLAGMPYGGILYVPRGPILDFSAPDATAVFDKMLSQLKELARKRLAVVRVSPDVEAGTKWVSDVLVKHGFQRSSCPVQHTCTFRLDLRQSADAIMAGLEPRTRYAVRRLSKCSEDWKFRVETSLSALDEFYQLYAGTMARAGKGLKSLQEMRVMLETLGPCGSAFVFLAECTSRLVSGALLVALGKRLWYLYGGSARSVQVSGAGEFLHWQIIQWAQHHNYEEYDLQGVPCSVEQGDPEFGVYLFKRGWGGRRVELIGEFEYSPLPLLGAFLGAYLARK